MPKFNITQIVRQVKTYEYTIEAATEEEALSKMDTLNYDSVSDGEEEIISTNIKEC